VEVQLQCLARWKWKTRPTVIDSGASSSLRRIGIYRVEGGRINVRFESQFRFDAANDLTDVERPSLIPGGNVSLSARSGFSGSGRRRSSGSAAPSTRNRGQLLLLKRERKLEADEVAKIFNTESERVARLNQWTPNKPKTTPAFAISASISS
jgi:hypothetical protein